MGVSEDQIRDIFAIPHGKNEETSDYSLEDPEVIAKVPFDERVSEIQDKMPQEENKMDSETLIKSSIVEVDQSDEESSEDDFDRLDVPEKEKEKPEPEPEKPVEKKEIVEEDVQVTDGEVKWLLKSPSDKFDRFYAEKKDILPKLLAAGQIQYSRWLKELKNSSVDINVMQIYDLPEIHEKMQHVHMVRDRVQEIGIQCNAQYFLWERAVEMFHGLLARTARDVKPALAREGLAYEHMRDMELYFANLKGLHRVTDQVLKTLELAFDCLSRQLTIAMQNKDIPNKYANQDNQQQQISINPDGFDELPKGAESKVVQKTQEIEWSDI